MQPCKKHTKLPKTPSNPQKTKSLPNVLAITLFQTEKTRYETLCRLTEQPIYKMYSNTKKRTFEYTFQKGNHDIETARQRIRHQVFRTITAFVVAQFITILHQKSL